MHEEEEEEEGRDGGDSQATLTVHAGNGGREKDPFSKNNRV